MRPPILGRIPFFLAQFQQQAFLTTRNFTFSAVRCPRRALLAARAEATSVLLSENPNTSFPGHMSEETVLRPGGENTDRLEKLNERFGSQQ